MSKLHTYLSTFGEKKENKTHTKNTIFNIYILNLQRARFAHEFDYKIV